MGYKINIRNTSNNDWINLLQDQYIIHDNTTTGIGTSATTNVELALKYLHDNEKPTGLELITETAGVSGWRLIGKNDSHYGNIGDKAVDISESSSSSSTRGSTGKWSFASGLDTTASGEATFVSGYNNHAEGNTSFVEGHSNHATGSNGCHASGHNTISSGETSYTEGYATSATNLTSHAEGCITLSSGNYSHAEGYQTTSSGLASHAGGRNNVASGDYSHVEGKDNIASGNYSHASGLNTIASGLYSYTEGWNTIATSYMDHAQGHSTSATGGYGCQTTGWVTLASGRSSHAEGHETEAHIRYSHAEGYGTKTSTDTSTNIYGQHVAGKFNIGTSSETIHETGIGIDDTNRKNAFEIYIDGTATLPEATITEISSRGDNSIITKEYLDSYRYRTTITTASSAWVLTHNLGEQLVSVTIMDASTNTQINPASITYDSTTQLTVTFSSAVSGSALVIK